MIIDIDGHSFIVKWWTTPMGRNIISAVMHNASNTNDYNTTRNLRWRFTQIYY